MLWNHLYEKDPGDAWDVPRAPWDPGIPWALPWDPQARPWNARDAMGPPGTSLRPLGTPLGPPGTTYGRLMDNKNHHISINIQRQKLSMAVLDPAHEGPSHERLDRAVFSMNRPPKSKNAPPAPGYPRAGYG